MENQLKDKPIISSTSNIEIEEVFESNNSSVNSKIDRTKHLYSGFSIADKDILVPESFWKEYFKNGNLIGEWADAFSDIFEMYYPNCVFNVKWKTCNPHGGRNKAYVIITGRCAHSKCTAFKFIVNRPPTELNTDKYMKAFRCRNINHLPLEEHRRRVRGTRRIELGERLKQVTPYRLHLEVGGEADKKQVLNGNHNHTLSLTTAQKTSSENRLNADVSLKDDITKISDEYRNKWERDHTSGFIQWYNPFPVFIILFTEDQLQIVLDVPRGSRFANIDATGTIIQKPTGSKMVLLYLLILPGNRAQGPFCFAELKSAVHSVPELTFFLHRIDYAFRQMSSVIGRILDKLESDFSLAILQSTSSALNKMHLMYYVDLLYRKYETEEECETDHLTVLHICSPHAIKTVLKNCDKKGLDEEQRMVVGNQMTRIIHSESLKEALSVFRDLVKVLGRKSINDSVYECLENIRLPPGSRPSDSTSLQKDETDEEIKGPRTQKMKLMWTLKKNHKPSA